MFEATCDNHAFLSNVYSRVSPTVLTFGAYSGEKGSQPPFLVESTPPNMARGGQVQCLAMWGLTPMLWVNDSLWLEGPSGGAGFMPPGSGKGDPAIRKKKPPRLGLAPFGDSQPAECLKLPHSVGGNVKALQSPKPGSAWAGLAQHNSFQ